MAGLNALVKQWHSQLELMHIDKFTILDSLSLMGTGKSPTPKEGDRRVDCAVARLVHYGASLG